MPEKEKRAQKLPRAWQAWYKEQEEAYKIKKKKKAIQQKEK
ncbi:hypothetical protein PDN33_27895 [Bacillus cereus]|nr:hypothetical protein [Bacillus cereus]